MIFPLQEDEREEYGQMNKPPYTPRDPRRTPDPPSVKQRKGSFSHPVGGSGSLKYVIWFDRTHPIHATSRAFYQNAGPGRPENSSSLLIELVHQPDPSSVVVPSGPTETLLTVWGAGGL